MLENISPDEFLIEYHDYGQLYSTIIFTPDVWSNYTGCDITDYKKYADCCMKKLYDFKTWYEHSYGVTFPEEWKDLIHHRYEESFNNINN